MSSYSRIYYGASAADSTAASLKHHHHGIAPAYHAAAAANYSYATQPCAATPVRGTTPLRSSTPVRTTRAVAAAPSTPVRKSEVATTSSSSSTFMTQAARNVDATPQRQVLRSAPESHAHTAPLRRGPTLLPPTRLESRQLLVLDMDETLLHAEVSPTAHDVSFVVRMDNGATTPVYVKFRPHLARFLSVVSRLFEVVVFTASISKYANQVLDYIDPTGELVHHRLYREHCTEVNGTYVKDLELLGRPLQRVAIVDNSPIAYSFHPGNAIAIPSWYDCERDLALQHLLPHLEKMARAGNVYDGLNDIRRVLQWD